MADLTTLLSKFLQSLYTGTLYSNPFGATSVGMPVIQAQGRALAQTAAVASVATYTVGASDGTFEISANALATTATTFSFSVEVAFTDEASTARSNNLPFALSSGTVTGTLSNGNGASYAGVPITVRAKAGTTITVRTSAGGTYTTVTYNVEGCIKQVA
jgi:hypothetical protein